MAGKFIVFEGIDGSGKTTHMRMVKKQLDSMSIPSCEHCEPTDGAIGRLIRRVLSGELSVESDTLALLFAADRREHINHVVTAQQNGAHVLCDRYVYSSMAYQALDLPLERVLQYNSENLRLLAPDAVVFIDTPPEICMQRINAERGKPELFETLERLTQVQSNYKKALNYCDERTKVVFVDGSMELDTVCNKICKELAVLLQT